jgi:hydroxymethylbilane synthase
VTDSKLIIATRGSKLALWQAEHVRERLQASREGLEVELLVVKTRGDKILDVPLAKVGGKALFVKEIEQALLDGRAQVAVHSMKDVPAELAPGLHMAAVSEREDPRDAWIASSGQALEQLPAGSVVGTSSMRRQCQILAARPELRIEMLRGNVPTRLGKLDEGNFDAIVLAAAGLRRLGFGDRITESLEPTGFVPAVGQGALGIETRADDAATTELVRAAMHHEADARRVAAERAFLLELEGGCQTPLAAHATYRSGQLHLDALIGRPDGTEILRADKLGAPSDAEAMGAELAVELLGRGGRAILDETIAAGQ